MSVESVLQRVATLEQALTNPAALLAASARTGGTAAPAALSETTPQAASASGGSTFAEALQSASAGYADAASGSALATATSASGAEAANWRARDRDRLGRRCSHKLCARAPEHLRRVHHRDLARRLPGERGLRHRGRRRRCHRA